MYHVTLLSNFARAFDKYQRRYRKSGVPESTYPNEFYVLPLEELRFGVVKALRLRDKLEIPGDTLLALEAELPKGSVSRNTRNGVGYVWPSPDLPVSAVRAIAENGELADRLSFEQTMARSLALHEGSFAPYDDIRPRSVSFLPIAKGCQAACPFCYSEASASVEQTQQRIDWVTARRWVEVARHRGAERAVITGGGEPTLLRWTELVQLVQTCRSQFHKVVLISNGVRLAKMDEPNAVARLKELHDAGLSVLALSRHHPSEVVNARLMNLETLTPALLRRANNKETLPNLQVRLICVLQRGGVKSVEGVAQYIAWAVSAGVEEVCFKELYVSTSQEFVYHSLPANEWSAQNQVSLSLVHQWAESRSFHVTSKLPWGAPVYGGTMDGKSIRVAAYTEPSLFWERSRGIARSWNVMADGTCLASLEDRRSIIEPVAIEPVP